jgi:hypothetical protein
LAKERMNYRRVLALLARVNAAISTRTETESMTQALHRVTEGEGLVHFLVEGRGAFPEWTDPYHENTHHGE